MTYNDDMSEEKYKYQREVGDPNSELNVQRRLRRMRHNMNGGVINIPQQWIDEDPAFQRALAEGLFRLPESR